MTHDKMLRMCLKKKKYRKETADKVIKKRGKDGVKLRSYYCPLCFGFHITHKELRC